MNRQLMITFKKDSMILHLCRLLGQYGDLFLFTMGIYLRKLPLVQRTKDNKGNKQSKVSHEALPASMHLRVCRIPKYLGKPVVLNFLLGNPRSN